MKDKGKRIYSNEEIRQMAMIGLDDEFVDYLRTAPDRVKQIVEDMLPCEQAKCELKVSYEKRDFDNGYEEEENLQTTVEKFEQIVIPICDEVQENVDLILQNEVDEFNPYIGMDFSKRLELNELRVTLTCGDECLLHNKPYEKIQVVLLYGGGKKFGAYLQCCCKCKKIFIKEEAFKELEIRLQEKNIKYSIVL